MNPRAAVTLLAPLLAGALTFTSAIAPAFAAHADPDSDSDSDSTGSGGGYGDDTYIRRRWTPP
ncbi:hypothetical protein ABT147_15110 [Streptomyces sp. NPDC001868]|uniref:hypothetical protein n=1 Tax=Streptomyces sp. NPDC001868 TaxID=3154401 RepID=UPI00332E8519